MPAIPPPKMTKETGGSDDPCGPYQRFNIGDPGGLTQFGVFVEILPPGSRSSITHWHANEDEMVFVLDGQVTLIEDKSETLLQTGDAATFKAGAPTGHCLENRSTTDTRLLVVGTRAAADQITYPDQRRILHRDRATQSVTWTDLNGNPASNPFST